MGSEAAGWRNNTLVTTGPTGRLYAQGVVIIVLSIFFAFVFLFLVLLSSSVGLLVVIDFFLLLLFHTGWQR